MFFLFSKIVIGCRFFTDSSCRSACAPYIISASQTPLLCKENPMAVSYVPSGQHTITPHLVVRGAAKAVEFYQKAFGMTEVMIMHGPDGKSIAHAELKLGDSHIYLADEWPNGDVASPEKLSGTTVAIHIYVPDCDAVFNKAVAAGCKVIMPPMVMFWGDRFAKVQDPFGHSWSIATHVEDMTPEEMAKRGAVWMKEMMAKK
jgi:PhnB protein